MNRQLVFLTIKEANKPVHNGTRKWKDKQEVLDYYLGYFEKVKQEFRRHDDEGQRLAFNDFCTLCRADFKQNFKTYSEFEQKCFST